MKRYFVFLAFALIPFYACAQLEGKVISISDGDTFTLLVDKEAVKVRLHGIDVRRKNRILAMLPKRFFRT